MINILLLGAPGAGKGTVAHYLSENYKFNLLSTGNMLRQAIADNTDIGLAAKSIMDSGQLVPDEIMLDLVQDFIKQNQCEVGWVFDGFPRTIVQAEAMQNRGIQLDLVISLEVEDEVIVNRMSGRRVHTSSGRVYHIINNPPKIAGKDDITGEDLVIRADDEESVVRERLAVFKKLTAPLIDFYNSGSNFKAVNAALSVEQVNHSIKQLLKELV